MKEEVSSKITISSEELKCENYFTNTVNKSRSRRYVVHLQFRSLVENKTAPSVPYIISVYRRLRQLEISFSKRPNFAERYRNLMREYKDFGHMTKFGNYAEDVRPNSYFLPYHGVLKESSITSKLRVIFNESCHLINCKALNEELCPGPVLQNALQGIISKWGRYRNAFSTDIEKMFRPIDVYPEHIKNIFKHTLTLLDTNARIHSTTQEVIFFFPGTPRSGTY